MFVLFLQPTLPPSLPMRHVRPMSDRLPSHLALASSGFNSSPTRAIVAKASKFHMSLTMVSHSEHKSDGWVGSNIMYRLPLVSIWYFEFKKNLCCYWFLCWIYFHSTSLYTVLNCTVYCGPIMQLRCLSEDYQQLIEDIVRDGRLYASENHQEILKVLMDLQKCLLICTVPVK